MRPAGDISKALLQAIQRLVTEEQAPTVRELAAVTGIGLDAVMVCVDNLRRAEHVVVVRTRRVQHCKKPVAEYGLPALDRVAANDDLIAGGFAALAHAWG